jgi:hypothetical protein
VQAGLVDGDHRRRDVGDVAGEVDAVGGAVGVEVGEALVDEAVGVVVDAVAQLLLDAGAVLARQAGVAGELAAAAVLGVDGEVDAGAATDGPVGVAADDAGPELAALARLAGRVAAAAVLGVALRVDAGAGALEGVRRAAAGGRLRREGPRAGRAVAVAVGGRVGGALAAVGGGGDGGGGDRGAVVV